MLKNMIFGALKSTAVGKKEEGKCIKDCILSDHLLQFFKMYIDKNWINCSVQHVNHYVNQDHSNNSIEIKWDKSGFDLFN